MNGYLIGTLEQVSTGALIFQYAEEWLETSGARPLSLSLPLRKAAYEGRQVYNFFDNLLPDSKAIRDRIQARFQSRTSQPFDLLSAVGGDCVGAVQLCPQKPWPDVKKVSKTILSESDIAQILRGYRMSPLGMAKEADDFRISIAGAQEKTALLWHNEQWCLPAGPTPTSHIFKLPIGFIQNNSIDLSESCENEWLCLEIAKAFGLPVAHAEVQQFEDVKVLVVERFDRRWSRDGRWLMRLPQEDLCQAMGVAASRKYQSDGGPGIAETMKLLLGSKQAQADREQFFRTQILFWLLAATDGHAKNFSIFLEPDGSYRLTPIYDVISVYPEMATQAIPKQKVKMAMALRGKNNRYDWSQLQPRHFVSTAKAANFSQKQVMFLLLEMLERAAKVAEGVAVQLPKDFPEAISAPILEGMVTLAQQQLPTVYEMIEDYAQQGEYEVAIALYTHSLNIKVETGDQQGQATILQRMAGLYNIQGDFENAIEYHTQFFDLAQKNSDQQGKIATLSALAGIYNNQEKFEHAIAFYKQSLDLQEQTQNQQGKADTLVILGQLLAQHHDDIETALVYLQEALKIMQTNQVSEDEIDYVQSILSRVQNRSDV